MLLATTSRRSTNLLGAMIFKELHNKCCPSQSKSKPPPTHLLIRLSFDCTTSLLVFYVSVIWSCSLLVYISCIYNPQVLLWWRKVGNFHISCWYLLWQLWNRILMFSDFILLLCVNEVFTVLGMSIWFSPCKLMNFPPPLSDFLYLLCQTCMWSTWLIWNEFSCTSSIKKTTMSFFSLLLRLT